MNCTLCNHRLWNPPMKMLNGSGSVKWHGFCFLQSPPMAWADFFLSSGIYVVVCLFVSQVFGKWFQFPGDMPSFLSTSANPWQVVQQNRNVDGGAWPSELWFHHARHGAGTDSHVRGRKCVRCGVWHQTVSVSNKEV